MSGTVSTRFYFPDWLSDPGLRASSLAARGLWMDLLCYAGSNKGKDHGYVSLNGRKLTEAEVARMVNAASEVEVFTLLQELELNGVFSRDRRGVIYCRRMVRAEKNRTNGRLGGNPNLMKTKENQKSVQPEAKPLIPEPVPKPKNPPLPPRGSSDAPKTPRAKPRCRIPSDAVIGDRDLAFAAENGFDARRAAVLFENFRDHHASRGNQMADWPAAWRTWVRNEIKFSKQRGGSNGKAADAKVGFSGIAARIRHGDRRDEEAELFRPAPAAREPID